MTATQSEFRHLALASILFSTSTAQAERRKHFNKAQLEELAVSIKDKGIVQPIVVRPVVMGALKQEQEYELVAGERRVLAARIAKLDKVPAIVRMLTDDQAQEIQLIENLQRQDLHELVEAEGYEVLAKRGMTPEEIAHKVGKSKSTVYARMKLLALGEKGRAAFHAGEISPSIALLLARIPVHELQEKALAKIQKPHEYRAEPMTYREAQRYVQDEYTLKLAGAPFPREDATLCPKAGACGPCPKRTGNQPADLFGDIKSADVCTDPVCFKEKRQAFQAREVARAKAIGAKMLTGPKAKAVLPDRWACGENKGKLRGGYVKPTDKCASDPKKRTYAELAGKDAVLTLILNPDNGKASRAFALDDIKQALKDKGVTLKEPSKEPARSTGGGYDYEAERRKREREERIRVAVFAEVRRTAAPVMDRQHLEALVAAVLDGLDSSDLFPLCGWPEQRGHNYGRKRIEQILSHLKKLDDTELNRLAKAATELSEIVDSYGDRKPAIAAIGRLGLDGAALFAAAEAAEKAKEGAAADKPAKKSKSKK